MPVPYRIRAGAWTSAPRGILSDALIDAAHGARLYPGIANDVLGEDGAIIASCSFRPTDDDSAPTSGRAVSTSVMLARQLARAMAWDAAACAGPGDDLPRIAVYVADGTGGPASLHLLGMVCPGAD